MEARKKMKRQTGKLNLEERKPLFSDIGLERKEKKRVVVEEIRERRETKATPLRKVL